MIDQMQSSNPGSMAEHITALKDQHKADLLK
jgi:hypothetical protein